MGRGQDLLKVDDMTGLRRLIVNADGFGFGPGATQGVLEAIREGGFISSVSVNANFPDAERVCELVKEFPSISVGVHLNPLAGQPCLPRHMVPTMVDGAGYFHNEQFRNLLRQGHISVIELERELDAQISRIKALIGERLTHLDSQENLHLDYWDVFLRLAKKWNIQYMRNNASLICLESPTPILSRFSAYIRNPSALAMHQYRKIQMMSARSVGMRMADRLITVGYAGLGDKSQSENWRQVLNNLPPGTYEIYCHPAYPDETLRRWAWYCDARAQELDILRRPTLRSTAQSLGIEVIGFSQV